ncbi:MFS transporter [Streptomyces olivochromogenes]|uniref:MFS transporter n=1 Tax=Streptomyces olivochromogenes TaxID=1963 RepID=UPI001F21F3B7|nr:MFS transporter [Streptomyces olivochromogenes]MCF3129179.1 hypothetical protein [Streptomyces olivochromogenes]
MRADDLCGAQGSTGESGDPACRVVLLKSSTPEVAILSSLGVLPFLLFSLPAGVVVDRLAKHKLMMWCDIGRLLLPGDERMDANGKPGTTASFAEFAGPSIGGGLVGLLGVARAICADAATYALSAFVSVCQLCHCS